MAVMVTPDGAWRVEAIELDGHPCFRITLRGYLYGGSNGWRQGLCRTPAEVAAILGEAFALLEPDQGQ